MLSPWVYLPHYTRTATNRKYAQDSALYCTQTCMDAAIYVQCQKAFAEISYDQWLQLYGAKIK